MRQISAVVCYHGNTVYSISTLEHNTYGGCHNNLLREIDGISFKTFNSMYSFVLKLVSVNGFFLAHYTEFSREWYDILWYDIQNPTHHEKFGFNPKIKNNLDRQN